MNKQADSYGRALFEIGIKKRIIEESRKLYSKNPALKEALCNPSVTKEEKHRVIDAIFSPKIRNFLKVLCDNGSMDQFEEIYRSYEGCCLESENILTAKLIYVTEPQTEQLEAMKQTLALKYDKDSVKLDMKQDASLIGGFLLRVGDEEYDYSVKGRLAQLYKKLAWR
ncbi:ATP synthase F1 subunit delta [Anaerovorax sp. IOR16]|uniref:ATP synthase F1 subunit delta n=1 Tax=Anaerovorax sp. IOR16 TaxID=2773458 RepID=UPI0019D154B8|nr:ATP synthase F1 subunit delta [Anaerovorax sp. IOR16]